MEFINLDNFGKLSYNKNVTETEDQKLYNEFSSTEISTYEHEMNNGFIDCFFGETLRQMRLYNYNFLGVGKAPWPHHDWNMAVVFEDKTTFEKYWCHVAQYLIDEWREEKGKYS